MAAPPKSANHNIVSPAVTIMTPITISQIVHPLKLRAIKLPTKGAQLSPLTRNVGPSLNPLNVGKWRGHRAHLHNIAQVSPSAGQNAKNEGRWAEGQHEQKQSACEAHIDVAQQTQSVVVQRRSRKDDQSADHRYSSELRWKAKGDIAPPQNIAVDLQCPAPKDCRYTKNSGHDREAANRLVVSTRSTVGELVHQTRVMGRATLNADGRGIVVLNGVNIRNCGSPEVFNKNSRKRRSRCAFP